MRPDKVSETTEEEGDEAGGGGGGGQHCDDDGGGINVMDHPPLWVLMVMKIQV